jgi:hypothetical protein
VNVVSDPLPLGEMKKRGKPIVVRTPVPAPAPKPEAVAPPQPPAPVEPAVETRMGSEMQQPAPETPPAEVAAEVENAGDFTR